VEFPLVDAGPEAAANDACVRDFLVAWQRRDTEALLDALTEDAVYHAVPLPPIVGKSALAEWVRAFEGKAPPRLDVHRQVASAAVVMNERTDHMTLSGRPVTLPICAVFELEGGRIRAWREYFDLAPAKAAYGES
jgi:limonene-1,2-epoxide hydrolase